MFYLCKFNKKEKQSRKVEGCTVSEELKQVDSKVTEKNVALSIFSLIERLMLIIVVLMTLGGVGFEILAVYRTQSIALADILLMFLYL